ncbi:hypothetical protein MPER_13793, partial [Moniliophthora perniciosa FA553]
DQAEREAKYSRSSHGRSATAMAAYDGQSGSKDRGDPQVEHQMSSWQIYLLTSLNNPWATSLLELVQLDRGPGADMTASRRSKNA